MSKQVVSVQVRNVYGVAKAYPISEAAKILAEIAGVKVLPARVLDAAKRLGFEVVDVSGSRIGEVA